MSRNQEGTTAQVSTAQVSTARVIQFPARGRFAKANSIDARLAVVGAPSIAVGGSWYHDEAIEAERTRKN